MGRRSFVPLKEWNVGEGFLELEGTFRELTRKEEDVMLKRATREALDRLWARKGVRGATRDARSNPVSREVRYK